MLWAHDIPIQAKDELAVTHGEIYYGLQTNDRVYVHTTEKEFDFPRGDANAETVYGGRGGIPLPGLWRKLVVAHAFDGLRLFLSDYFTPQSRVLIRRNVVERVQRLAPFITFDHDPYIVADGDHYAYIIDGYTSSANYPYSETYQGSVDAFHDRNYLRNSVKAVVDAYNGSVTFYVFAPDDPIIKAYRKMLPGLFKDRSAMPGNLQRHIRYPEDLFTVQAEMYGTYHMTNPTTFYNREDRWEVPRELYRNSEIEVQPYYVMAQMPGRQPGIHADAAAVGGGQEPDGGVARRPVRRRQLRQAGRLPLSQGAVRRRPGADRVADQFGQPLFGRPDACGTSTARSVIRGNLIILPLAGDQLVAIEPIYIEAEQTGIPTLARVVFGQLMPDDRKIEWASISATPRPSWPGSPWNNRQGRGIDRNHRSQTGSSKARSVFRDMQQEYAAGNFARDGEPLQAARRGPAAAVRRAADRAGGGTDVCP